MRGPGLRRSMAADPHATAYLGPRCAMCEHNRGHMLAHATCVQVTPNLYGNLVSNVVAGLCGGFGVVPGAYMGNPSSHAVRVLQGTLQG